MFHAILFGSGRHQVRQDRERHIFKRDRPPVKQFQIISTILFYQRHDLVHIKRAIVGTVNTRLKFLFCKVGQKELHHFICRFLIRESGQCFQFHIQRRDRLRHKQAAIVSQSL